MHRTTVLKIIHIWMGISLLLICGQGMIGEEYGGWVVDGGERIGWVRGRQQLLTRQERRGWEVALVRSVMLYVLWEISGRVGTDWLHLLPWLIWLLGG